MRAGSGTRLVAGLVCMAVLFGAASAAAQKKPAAPKRPAAAKSSTCTLQGRVLDSRSGKTIPSFPLIVLTDHKGGRTANRMVTDGGGRYKLSVPRGARVTLYISPYDREAGATFLLDESWLESWRPTTLNVTRDMVHDIKVTLEDARTVTVTVTEPEGKPAAGARILIGRTLGQTNAQGRASMLAPKRRAHVAVMAVSADRSHACAAQLQPGMAELKLRLEPLQSFTGTITTPDGKPVAGLEITAIPMAGGEEAFLFMEPVRMRTDAEGRFQLKGLPGTDWMLAWEKSAGVKRGTATVALKGTALEPVQAQPNELDPALLEGSIGRTPETKLESPSCFALDAEDNILVCDEERSAVLKVSPDDRLLATWPLKFKPQAITVRKDGSVVVAGHGSIAILDPSGEVKVSGKVPSNRSVTAVAAEGSDVFVCAHGETGFVVYRIEDDLKEPRRIINNLAGCCGQMDIAAYRGHLYAAENTRFSVGKYTFDGKKVADFVHSDAKKADYYGDGCCEPKNLCFGPDGSIYTAASGQMEVKRYSPDGKFLNAVGQLPDADGSCVRVTVRVTKDASRVYILDTSTNLIRLLKQP